MVWIEVIALWMMFQLTRRQLRRSPRTVDARGPRRSDQSVLLVLALVLDVFVVADRLNVVTILILAPMSDQQHFAVRDVAREPART